MALNILLVVVGFIILYYGSEWLVGGASAIATTLNLSKAVVGVILVAFGTSSPELFVNSVAAGRGHTDFALTNIAGSNLANLCMGLGGCAIIGSFAVPRGTFGTDLLYFAAAPLLILLPLAFTPGHTLSVHLTWLFLAVFAAYLSTIRKRIFDAQNERPPSGGLTPGILRFLGGCAALYAGGELIVQASISIARILAIPETVIGLTIVAVGTSIPDITASWVAFRRNETAIAIGNIIGSNIFNILLVTSATLLFSGKHLAADRTVVMDYTIVCAASALFVGVVFLKNGFARPVGLVTIVSYMGYIGYRIM